MEKKHELKQVKVVLNLQEEQSLFSEQEIHYPEDAVRIMTDVLSKLDREEVCVVNMDSAGRPINYNVVSVGDLNQSMVPVQNVFKSAILSNASSIILLHNHPSGKAYSSKEDVMVTKKLMYASTFMDIPVRDHIVVAGRTGMCYSMLSHNPELFEREKYNQMLSQVADGGSAAFEQSVKENNETYRASNIPGEERLFDSETRFGIYQITRGGKGEAYRFMGMDFAEEQQLLIDGADYSLIYTEVLPAGENLDSIYRRFNINRSKDFEGHSLSVSDVIVLQTEMGGKAYYVDSLGFRELPEFIKQRERVMDGVDSETMVNDRIVKEDENPFVAGTSYREVTDQGVIIHDGMMQSEAAVQNRAKDSSNFQNDKQEAKKPYSKDEKKKTRYEAVKEITEKLEQGITELFESDKYKNYLLTMSKFHRYSFNNSLLIAMQRPDATLVAGYTDWQKKFHRQVKKGAKAIRIFAPAPYKKRVEREVKDANGKVRTEEAEIMVTAFKAAPVFDVSDTYGDPLPEIGADELLGTVDGYDDFMKAIWEIAPVPVDFGEIKSGAKGYFSRTENQIMIQRGMSESQTMKTAIHELTHALLDGEESLVDEVELDKTRGRSDKEVTAESVAFTVASHFGLDTSDYSFGYIAGWSSGREMKELRSSMERIQKTASKIISDIEEKIHTYRKERVPEQEEVQKENEELYAALDVKNARDIIKVGETELQENYQVSQKSKTVYYTNPFAEDDKMPMQLEISYYLNNGQIFIGMIVLGEEDGPEPYGNLTVNLGVDCAPYCSYIDTNNMPNAENFIVENGLGQFTGFVKMSGYCEYPLYQFDSERLRQLESEGLRKYEKYNGIEPEKEQKKEHELTQEHKQKRY